MNSKRGAVIVFSILLTLAFSLCIAAAECHDLIEKAQFNASDAGKEFVLCRGSHPTPIEISGVMGMTLDCNDSTLTGGIIITNSARVVIKGCTFKVLGLEASNMPLGMLTLANNSFDAVGAKLRGVTLTYLRNNVFENSNNGLEIYDSTSVAVDTNEFNRNGLGLYLEQANGVTITSRNIFRENTVGLLLNNSAETKIYKNVFIKPIGVDAICAKVIGAASTNNSWFMGIDGNYWSDYVGADLDNNGVGDTPYVIPSALGEDKDNFPFMNADFSSPENVIVGRPNATIIGEVTERSGEFTLNVTQAVKFMCKGNTTYELVLAQTTPMLLSYINQDAEPLQSFKSNIYDLDGDGVNDINIIVTAHSLNSAGINLVRLDPCMSYCGDNTCNAGETASSCSQDCSAGQAESDNDADGVSIAAGDCDDSNPKIYPGAKESCVAGIDYDCDGLSDEEDPDCQGMGFGFWFFATLAILAAVAAAVIYFWKREPSTPEEEVFEEETSKIASAPIEKEVSSKIKKIMDYADNFYEKGESTEHIKEILLAQGWQTSDINEALRELAEQHRRKRNE